MRVIDNGQWPLRNAHKILRLFSFELGQEGGERCFYFLGKQIFQGPPCSAGSHLGAQAGCHGPAPVPAALPLPLWLVSVWDSLAVGVCLITVAHSWGCQQREGPGAASPATLGAAAQGCPEQS